jgi:hypothetical protein
MKKILRVTGLAVLGIVEVAVLISAVVYVIRLVFSG